MFYGSDAPETAVAEIAFRTDYGACQALAERARAAGIQALRYASVRAPADLPPNLASLTCRVFMSRSPQARQTWRLLLGTHGARAVCERPKRRLQFDRRAFADDPRIAALDWSRE